MTEKKPKPDDPEQSKRFIATAKEVDAGDEQALDRAFKKIIPKPLKERKARS